MNPADKPPVSTTGGQATSANVRRHGGSTARLLRLCRKEWREILRDRRTIVTLVLMPLLVYPILCLTFQRFLLTSLRAENEPEYVLGFPSVETGTLASHYLQWGDRLLLGLGSDEGASMSTVDRERSQHGGGARGDRQSGIDWTVHANLDRALADGTIDLGLRLRTANGDADSAARPERLEWELIYRRDSLTGKLAVEWVERRFRAVNDEYLRRRLEQLGVPMELPIVSMHRSVASSGTVAFSMATLIPLILILMTITGAVYPAIDLTAGERERGTLETLIAAPVPRFSLLVAKYVAVVTVAMLTATVNLAAMTLTLVATGLAGYVFGGAELSWLTVLQVFALLVLFAAFFSAVLLAITSFARSFKEAQAYLIPVMLLALAPGVLGMMPGLESSVWLSVTPLVNIVLLTRDVFQGAVHPTLATVAVLATALYAFAALGLAARIFGTDAVLYGSESSWSDLVRPPGQRRDVASVSGAMVCLAVIFPLYFLLANLLGRLPDAAMEMKLVLTGLTTLVLFGGLPIVAAGVQRLRIQRAFQLSRPGGWALIASVLLGISLWPLAHEVFLLNQVLGLSTISDQEIESVEALLRSWRAVSPLLILLSLAAAPAVGEELFFRGYLLSALRRATAPHTAILASAVLFGLFHVVVTSVLATERFLPSALLGLVLGWVCWRTASVLPGMLLHGCHNGLLLLIAYYRDELIGRGFVVREQDHLPPTWLAAAFVGVALGIVLVWAVTRKAGRGGVAIVSATAQ